MPPFPVLLLLTHEVKTEIAGVVGRRAGTTSRPGRFTTEGTEAAEVRFRSTGGTGSTTRI